MFRYCENMPRGIVVHGSPTIAAFLTFGLASAVALEAVAQVPPSCAEVSSSAPGSAIYLRVGDTQQPLIKRLGKALLSNQTPKKIQLIYVTSGSCTNVEEFWNDNPITTNAFYVPNDPDFDPNEAAPTCTMPSEGISIDLGNSATFVSSCTSSSPPPDVQVLRGPLQAYLFVVPKTSSQDAITAREAYFAFGFGDRSPAYPWNKESFFYIRPDTKSSIRTPSAAIGLQSTLWRGDRLDKSTEVLSAIVNATDANRSIGILGAQIYDDNRDKNVKALAFRSAGQHFAYYPDSTREARDKLNLRKGRYGPWSPTEWMIRVDSNGDPENEDAAYVADLILGKTVSPAPDFETIDTIIEVGQVPDCAMEVTREFEGAPLSLYTPEEPCSCYYESKVGQVDQTSCASCGSNADCASGTCRRGFCEAQ